MKTVLVIEDELPIRENIQEILEAEQFKVITAENGAIGLQLAQTENPDLILCDIMMPEKDGYTVLATLRQSETTIAIPVIFLTAKSDRSSVREGMEQGVDDYLTKPFSINELRNAITTQLGKRATLEQRDQRKLFGLCNSIAYAFPRELISPLNDILGLAQLLIEEHGMMEPAEALEIAETIYNSGKSLHRLAQNFLIYSRLETIAQNLEQRQSFRFTQSRCVIQDVLPEVAWQRAGDYGRANDLQIDVQNAIVCLAEHDLRKIVDELIDNAFKFSTAGDSVRVVGCTNNDRYNIYVMDHGRGMTTEQIAALDVYTQFGRRCYEQKGCGLGLAIAYRIIQLYDGHFSINSIPKQHTTVRLSLPGSLPDPVVRPSQAITLC